MIRSFPFDAVLDSSGIPDRAYLSSDFAKYFAKFISNGVFPNPSTGLQVVAVDNNMQVRMKQGDGYIYGRSFENTDDYTFKLDPADGVLNRIDRIVLRLDYLKRDIIPVLKKGQFASSPVPPKLTRNADAYEIALADIYVRAGVISIIQSNITDLRFNKELCGLVHATVEQIDSTVIFNQFQDWYKQKQNEYDNDISKWTTEKKQTFNNWYAVNTQAWVNEFQTWFDTLKTKLDGDVAAKLTADVEGLKSQVSDMATKTEVQAAQSKADSAYTVANSKQYKLTISSSTASTSTTQVANSYAVKQAYDRAEQAFQNLSNGKQNLSTALREMGVTVDSNGTFQAFADGIKSISKGINIDWKTINLDFYECINDFFEDKYYIYKSYDPQNNTNGYVKIVNSNGTITFKKLDDSSKRCFGINRFGYLYGDYSGISLYNFNGTIIYSYSNCFDSNYNYMNAFTDIENNIYLFRIHTYTTAVVVYVVRRDGTKIIYDSISRTDFSSPVFMFLTKSGKNATMQGNAFRLLDTQRQNVYNFDSKYAYKLDTNIISNY